MDRLFGENSAATLSHLGYLSGKQKLFYFEIIMVQAMLQKFTTLLF